MPEIVVEVTRGPLVENRYRGDIAIVDSTGTLLFRVGEAHKVTYWRSSAKPIQALPIITTGAAAAFGYGPEDLAMIASSHNGEDVHLQAVAETMRKSGVPAEWLRCGVHPPLDRSAAEALEAKGQEPTVLHNNCSGKHTGMLALARHLGYSADDYLDPASELQQRILRDVADVTGVPGGQIAIGVDGCGVPVFGLPLFNMALAFSRLAEPATMPPEREDAARLMLQAMLDHPYLVAGRRRLCTDLMSLPGRRFVAKSGADGVYCVGVLPHAVEASEVLRPAGAAGGVGLSVKMENGDEKVMRDRVVVEVLRQLGLLAEADLAALARHTSPDIRNHAGKAVGERRTVVQLQRGEAQ